MKYLTILLLIPMVFSIGCSTLHMGYAKDQSEITKDGQDIALMCNNALTIYGLRNWDFAWINGENEALGVCIPITHTIYINRLKISDRTLDAVKTVMLHELAHALSWDRYCYLGHGEKWQKICVEELGIIPNKYIVEDECQAYKNFDPK